MEKLSPEKVSPHVNNVIQVRLDLWINIKSHVRCRHRVLELKPFQVRMVMLPDRGESRMSNRGH